jgi:hypothetical protein
MLITETKVCSICGEEKQLSEFYSQKKHSKKRGDWTYINPECIECTKNRSRKWNIENHEKVLDIVQKYNNKPERKKFMKNYRIENKEEVRISLKRWIEEHKDRLPLYANNHQNHDITNLEWECCKNYFNYRCCYCGIPIEDHWVMFKGKLINGDFHRDHADHNGENDLSNCIPACKSCNCQKWEYEFYEWYNEENPNFTYERLEKILKWLNGDYKLYITVKSK